MAVKYQASSPNGTGENPYKPSRTAVWIWLRFAALPEEHVWRACVRVASEHSQNFKFTLVFLGKSMRALRYWWNVLVFVLSVFKDQDRSGINLRTLRYFVLLLSHWFFLFFPWSSSCNRQRCQNVCSGGQAASEWGQEWCSSALSKSYLVFAFIHFSLLSIP